MRVILLGSPGAGKGTQAELLSQKLGLPHISTGVLFRANMQAETDLGKLAQHYMDAGELVPSDVTNKMVAARITEPDAAVGFVLDGYPRSVGQAEALDRVLKELGAEVDHVLHLVVDELVVVKRMKGRGRADDTDEVIHNRMRVYRTETEPLLNYYDGLVTGIDGDGTIDEVNERLLVALSG